MNTTVYLNGALVPKSEAMVSVSDYGFLYGYGLFETMRAYDSVIFRLDRHIERLIRSAGETGLTFDAEVLKQAVVDTVEANHLAGARVRLTVTGGEGSTAPDIGSCHHPTVLVTAVSYTPYDEEVYNRGFRLMTSRIRRNSRSPVSAMKTLNYLECLIARREAKAAGFDDGLLLNEAGFLAETAVSNIFLVRKETIITPDEASGILPGVTREAVIETAEKLSLPVEIRSTAADEIREADEVFVTNSLMEIMPVCAIDGLPVGTGFPGKVTNLLRCGYQELVERETE